ncbi:hypothetical protein TSAR_007881 [Trichomalopsis sarcophagae]|uniref:Granulins domain-containing protein n=1 Tax=Trichomalopsis sarcophagae TaxID=543379 RepID=A0A232FAE1_9HYME|nr:hypothetical protein TSAR_007881 [Trichomalopsis sarcophagae]
MARFVYLLLAIVLTATMVMAVEKKCSPWLGYRFLIFQPSDEQCQSHEGCCRHFTCATYQAKCVPVGGLIIPGRDTRPLGDGPFPPKGLFPAFDAVYPHLTQ